MFTFSPRARAQPATAGGARARHVQRYLKPLLQRIEAGDIDPSFVITHRMRLHDAPTGFALFNDKANECIKVVLTP